MWNIEDFIKEYYGMEVGHDLTLDEFESWKEENEIEEWDYPLDEEDHINELDLECEKVMFADGEWRWCELP